MTLPTTVYDLVCVAVVGAPSTGAFTLGAAVPGYISAAGNIPDGTQVSYGASDGVNSETSKGTISNNGLTLTRGEAAIRGSNGAAVVNFGAGVTVAIIFSGSDLTELLGAIATLQTNVATLQTNVATNTTNIATNTVGITALKAPVPVVITDAASTTFDAASGATRRARLTATGNRTLTAPTNPVDGQQVVIEHLASGAARTLTLTIGSVGAFRFGTVLTVLAQTASGKTDYVTVVYNGPAQRWDVVSVAAAF